MLRRGRQAGTTGMLGAAGALVIVAVLSVAGARAEEKRGPFDAARLVPADVGLFLHVENARDIRADIARRPITRAAERMLREGEVAKAWQSLARRSGLDGATLFDRWLGRRFTLAVRWAPPEREQGGLQGGEQQGEAHAGTGRGPDWVLLTTLDHEAARPLLRRLRPRRLAPRAGLPVAELPEHGLLVARDGGTFVIGPVDPGDLFDDVLQRLTGEPGLTPSLAEQPSVAKGLSLGGGRVAAVVHHGQGLGGWSVAVGDLEGGQAKLRHAAQFDRSPFQRPVSQLHWDMSPLDAVEDVSLLAMIEPTDIGHGPVSIFVEMVVGAPILSDEMRKNLGDCQIVAIGEVEGRQEPHRSDLQVPTGAVAIKLKNVDTAPSELDAQLQRLTERIGRRLGVDGWPSALERAAMRRRDGAMGHLDLDPLIALADTDLPFVRSVSLNWTVASGPLGSYYVVATHPDHLGRTVRALESAAREKPRRGRWTNCGTMNGQRIGVHLRGYSDQAAALAPEGQAEVFKDALLALSELAAGCERCRWQLTRPSALQMELDVQLVLSAPESAEDVQPPGNEGPPREQPIPPSR